MVSLLYFCFTDFNTNPEIKVTCGWVVLVILLSNLIYPNGYVMVTGMWPEIKQKFTFKKRRFVAKSKWVSRRMLINARRKFIKKNMHLKEEYLEEEEEEMKTQPRKY